MRNKKTRYLVPQFDWSRTNLERAECSFRSSTPPPTVERSRCRVSATPWHFGSRHLPSQSSWLFQLHSCYASFLRRFCTTIGSRDAVHHAENEQHIDEELDRSGACRRIYLPRPGPRAMLNQYSAFSIIEVHFEVDKLKMLDK